MDIVLSIIIVEYNCISNIRTCVETLRSHIQVPCEIIVSSNSCYDEAKRSEILKDETHAKWVFNERNGGFAYAMNEGLKVAKGKYLVIMNSDCIIASPLDGMIAFMDAHPEVAACQPKIKSWREPKNFEYAGAAGGFVDCYGYPFCRGRIFNSVEEDHGQYDTPMKVFWATGACLFIRLQDYREAGGLDARFFAHMEEIDLCWRLNARGREVWCIPESTVYHVGAATLKRENPHKTFLNFRNNLLMLYKNLPDNELHRVMHWRTFLDYSAVLSFVLKGQFANAQAVFQARKAYHRLRPGFFISRNLNMLARVEHPAQTCWMKCLLWAYYVQKKHTFAKLF